MAKQVCDIKGSAGMSRGQSNEHLRNYKKIDPEAKKYGYYDPTRMKLNFEITKGGVVSEVNRGYPLDKRFKDNLKARGIELPPPIKMKDGTKKERITLANIILQGSRERMLQLAFGDQHVDLSRGADNCQVTRLHDIEEWAKDMYNFMCRRYGEENIVSFVVHLDEKNPHIHCSIVPVVDGKISYNKLFGGKTKQEARANFRDIHDSLSAVNAKWGLERGTDIRKTGAKHRTSEEYWTHLREECTKLENQKSGLEGRIEGLNNSLALIEDEIHRATIKIKGLTTMVSNGQTVVNDLKSECSRLEEEIHNNTMTNDFLLEEAKEKLAAKEEYLRKKMKDLEEAKKALDMLKKQQEEKLSEIEKSDKRLNELREELKDYDALKEEKVITQIYNIIGFDYIDKLKNFFWKGCQDIRDDLPIRSIEKFDKLLENMLIPELAEDGDEIVNEAMSMFFGKEGVEIIVSGGGGGSSSSPKKRKDEDDYSFLGRCLLTAFARARQRSKGLRK